MLLAFTDGDGYYQIELADGEPTPEWARSLTPTAVAPLPQPDPKAVIQSQIDQIERDTLMNRAIREGTLLLIEKEAMREFGVDQATAQAGLYAGNEAYRRVKDVDNQIAGLRAQIGAA